MRAYWHKHVLRHAGTMLTSCDEVSEKARPFFVCRYIYLRQAILVSGRVPLCLHLSISPLIMCSSTAAWWSPPYPWTCLQVLGRVSYRLRLHGYAVTGSACASAAYACAESPLHNSVYAQEHHKSHDVHCMQHGSNGDRRTASTPGSRTDCAAHVWSSPPLRLMYMTG